MAFLPMRQAVSEFIQRTAAELDRLLTPKTGRTPGGNSPCQSLRIAQFAGMKMWNYGSISDDNSRVVVNQRMFNVAVT